MITIGDPRDLKLDDKLMEELKKQTGENIKFLSPDSTFKFSCDKRAACCKNRYSNPIILSPYDVLRLSRNRKMSTGKFLQLHTILTLGGQSHLPIALLKYEGDKNRNKCPFLRSYGCSVYQDRPLRCRLYPLGRVIAEDKSYFILTDTSNCCRAGQGRTWTLSEWIKESGLDPYFRYAMGYENLKDVDFEKYKELPETIKYSFGITIYDINRTLSIVPENEIPETDEEIMTFINGLIKSFFKEMKCEREEYCG